MIQTVSTAWIFDVDGVITNPREKRVTERGLVRALAERLDCGEIVTLNTGRSLSWMTDRVTKPIEQAVLAREKLSNFIAIGEKGGTWLTYDNGERVNHIDESIKVPENLKKKIRELIELEFSDSMFFDESKMTMISTEMLDGYSIPAYRNRQKELIRRMHEILEKPKYQGRKLQIDPTTIAADIQNTHVGKHLGARRIVDWLKEKGVKPKKVIAIGDSQSDTEMAEELQNKYSVEFVFVGEPSMLDKSRLSCPVIFTNKRYDEGTLEYLKNLPS